MNSLKCLMESEFGINIPVTYINEDVKVFKSFNGMTKIFMYDKAFNDDLLRAIAVIFNQSHGIQYIASSTKDLHTYGFEVELHKNIV